MTQRDRVLQYMRDFGSITQREAMEDLGCMRLASRIDELRHRGIGIITDTERGENRYGERTSWARYRLAE